MHIAILVTNTDESAFAQQHPKDGEKFQALLSPLRPEWSFSVYQVKDHIFPDDVSRFDGLIITGSPASIHDKEPWIAELLNLLRNAHDRSIPMFGACFGHQALAVALGGKVEKNPQGWVFGRVETQLNQPWDSKQLTLSLYGAHIEQVTELPADAVATGTTPGCRYASFSIGHSIWTTQYHPEMTHAFIEALVEEYASSLPPEIAAAARQSLNTGADRNTIATAIVTFFENQNAQDGSYT
ncbi:MAG: type 1 glutamine amidotransferase [Granulosicoccus sp.]|nr:type 1 glutamine amidotransferase [Granulosicoccus sp.]